MRRPQRQSRQRRREASHGSIGSWWRRRGEGQASPASVWPPRGLAALALLAGILVLFAGSGAGWADRQARVATEPQSASLHAAVGRSRSASSLPATGLWRDTVDSTTYTASFQPNADGVSAFDFTTPLGEEIQGFLPLVQLADGTYAQARGVKPGSTTLLAVTGCLRGTLQSDKPLPIFFTFRSHISQDGLAAFATFSYISVQDQTDFPLLCSSGSTGPGITTYQLQSGCTIGSCQDLASLAGPTVDKYDSAVLAAEQNGSVANWTAVYQLTCQQITAQYPLSEFASYLNQQVESVGKITQLSAPLSPPVPEYTPEGQAYFEIQQTVTVLQSGVSSSRALTSYYLLENGAWRFWFSD